MKNNHNEKILFINGKWISPNQLIQDCRPEADCPFIPAAFSLIVLFIGSLVTLCGCFPNLHFWPYVPLLTLIVFIITSLIYYGKTINYLLWKVFKLPKMIKDAKSISEL